MDLPGTASARRRSWRDGSGTFNRQRPAAPGEEVGGDQDDPAEAGDQPGRGRRRRLLHRRGRPAGPGAHRRPERPATAPGDVARTGGGGHRGPGLAVVVRHGGCDLVRRSGAFDVRIDVARLRPGQSIEGTWRLGIDSDPAVVGGFWTAERREMSALFRTWPATYRWTGTVTLGRRGSLVVVAHPPRATRLPVSCGTARRVRCRAGWCGGPGRRRPRPGGRPRAWPGCWTRSS